MFSNLNNDEIRNICRSKIESLEVWLRRLIDTKLSQVDEDYFHYKDSKGTSLIRNEIVSKLEERVKKEPERYKRYIDAILFSDAIDIICNIQLYKKYFSNVFLSYKCGRDEVKNCLEKLISPRNFLSHSNPISYRDAEKIICYANDIIDSIKEYYKNTNMEKDFNVPRIIKVSDSFGNIKHSEELKPNNIGETVVDYSNKKDSYLWPNDKLVIEVEVDSSFTSNEYIIKWYTNKFGYSVSNTNKIEIDITNEMVSCSFSVICEIISKKAWHKMSNGCDDYLLLVYKVLPLK